MAESNATGAETGKDGAAAGNADYVTKAELEALNANLAAIAKTLQGLPNMVNKAAQDHAGRQLKALGLTPEVLAKLTAPPKPEGEEGEETGDTDPPRPQKGKGGKQTETSAQSPAVDVEALLKKQAADFDRRVRELTRDITAERTARQAAERAQVETKAITHLQGVLTNTLRIKPDMVGDYVTIMQARKALTIGDDGSIVIKVGDEEHTTLDTGLAAFAKSYPGTTSFQQPPEGSRKLNPPPRPPQPVPTGSSNSSNNIGDRLLAAAAAQGVDVLGTIQSGIG